MTLVIAFINLNVSELKINENLPTLITKLFNISKYVLYWISYISCKYVTAPSMNVL